MTSAAELETGRCYVAVGTERFKKLPYVELLLSKATERYCYAKVLPACARADVRTCFGRSEDGNGQSFCLSLLILIFPSHLLDNIQGREN